MEENKKYNQKELEMGIEIEHEHKNLYDLFKEFCEKNKLEMPISDKEMYEMITKVHLDEIKDYNTRLKNMEKEADDVKTVKANLKEPILNTGASIYFIK